MLYVETAKTNTHKREKLKNVYILRIIKVKGVKNTIEV